MFNRVFYFSVFLKGSISFFSQGGFALDKVVVVSLGLLKIGGKGLHALVVITLGTGEDVLLLRAKLLDLFGQNGDLGCELQMALYMERTERFLFSLKCLSFFSLGSDALANLIVFLADGDPTFNGWI